MSLAVGFSQAVLGGGTAANFELQSAGADGLLGTADDTTIPLSASYSGTTTTLSFAALAAGLYRLTVFDTITDTGGNPDRRQRERTARQQLGPRFRRRAAQYGHVPRDDHAETRAMRLCPLQRATSTATASWTW